MLTSSPSASPPKGQSSPSASERVAILLSTYNGERFLAEQLDSLIAQTHKDWTIYASDDGSRDATLDILAKYRAQLGDDRLVIVQGPRQGFAANFLSLLAREEIQAPYFAFCDQDDLWIPERLAMGLDWMRGLPADRPALFCSRTQLIDSGGKPIGLSPLFLRPPTFENALVQSIAGGNTMLFNASTRELLRQTPKGEHIISHDWWTYLLVTGCGGHVSYDPRPTVDYRQHGRNLVGSNASLQERVVRVCKMFKGTFREWMDANLHALTVFRPHLTPDHQLTLQLFEQARASALPKRLQLIRKSGVHRQSPLGTLGLTAAAILHRI